LSNLLPETYDDVAAVGLTANGVQSNAYSSVLVTSFRYSLHGFIINEYKYCQSISLVSYLNEHSCLESFSFEVNSKRC
jgi:hypothetical protein